MDIYITQFVDFVLLFARITSVVVTSPVLGHQAVPVQLKVGIGLFLAYVLLPLQRASAGAIDLRLLGLVVLILQEVIVGMLIGFAAGLIFAGIQYAGELIGFNMGYTFASTFDPETNASTPVIGEMLYSFMTMVFILLNGHHFILQAIVLSYQSVPIGHLTISAVASDNLVALTGSVFVIAVKFAAPAIVALFLTDVALGVLTRIIPQMNIFGIAFPLKIGVGLIVLSTSMPILIYVFKKLLGTFENNIVELIKVL